MILTCVTWKTPAEIAQSVVAFVFLLLYVFLDAVQVPKRLRRGYSCLFMFGQLIGLANIYLNPASANATVLQTPWGEGIDVQLLECATLQNVVLLCAQGFVSQLRDSKNNLLYLPTRKYRVSEVISYPTAPSQAVANPVFSQPAPGPPAAATAGEAASWECTTELLDRSRSTPTSSAGAAGPAQH